MPTKVICISLVAIRFVPSSHSIVSVFVPLLIFMEELVPDMRGSITSVQRVLQKFCCRVVADTMQVGFRSMECTPGSRQAMSRRIRLWSLPKTMSRSSCGEGEAWVVPWSSYLDGATKVIAWLLRRTPQLILP